MAANILVVDDEDAIRGMIVTFLKNEGYQIDDANGVSAAMELLRSKDYDILLVDKNMPVMDGNHEGGLDILKHVRASRFLSTEVIMMTGQPSVETAIEAMKLGAFDYIIKPFPLEDLRIKLRRLLEYRSFIDPDYTAGIYRNIREKIAELLENKSKMSEGGLDQALLALNEGIDSIFKTLRESEKLVLVEREALARIAGLAEQLKMDTPKEDRFFNFLDEISRLSGIRL
jgi:DNA-binding NtrC family response regulator